MTEAADDHGVTMAGKDDPLSLSLIIDRFRDSEKPVKLEKLRLNCLQTHHPHHMFGATRTNKSGRVSSNGAGLE